MDMPSMYRFTQNLVEGPSYMGCQAMASPPSDLFNLGAFPLRNEPLKNRKANFNRRATSSSCGTLIQVRKHAMSQPFASAFHQFL
jgi:hypothetical protein